MKKILSFLLASILMLSLTACGEKKASESAEGSLGDAITSEAP